MSYFSKPPVSIGGEHSRPFTTNTAGVDWGITATRFRLLAHFEKVVDVEVEIKIAEIPPAIHVLMETEAKDFLHVLQKVPELMNWLDENLPVGVQPKIHVYSDEHAMSEEAAAAWTEAVLLQDRDDPDATEIAKSNPIMSREDLIAPRPKKTRIKPWR